ncbi:protein FAM117B-like [Artibeus jamaicensis]|uniref:protein FAM117B-like n=1 Tax=Artibeus jamaicensis TaxID=9417 RepID=UPI00235A97FF|nr:protein FAM117B-like [Artibeus jamaicensis]
MGEGAGGPRSGRGRGGGRGEVRRSSRVTSPTRRRGHRRSRRHFNRAFGLRSALSVRAKEPKRSASRSHSSASRPLFASRPPTSPPHTRRTHDTAAARSLPSFSSSVRPPRPRSTPSPRSPTPPSPDLSQPPEGKREASAVAGGVGSSKVHPPSNSKTPGVTRNGGLFTLESPPLYARGSLTKCPIYDSPPETAYYASQRRAILKGFVTPSPRHARTTILEFAFLPLEVDAVKFWA